ncbi:complex I assembly factor TIMMDC1, mitochondrial [Pogona vitticeps]|uniref:Complex I assembly factor TIMMDC1, mitochondrial n=1 Tax=Pogona vitticeps TaxID=103695 RepID=A0A6J0V4Q7_9SAUR|nr:complex I assembly factor TIMMDC1, mitochondrial [Pogona vitticeps]
MPRAALADGGAAPSSALAPEQRGLAQELFGLPPPPPTSGWERLRALVRPNEVNRYPEETLNIIKTAVAAGFIGLFYGGMPAFISAKKQYIERSDGKVFYNQLDAVQSAHRAGIRGFVRYGWRWGWRVAAFVGTFNIVNTGLTVYRDKNAVTHFAIAGGCTGALFRMHLGLRGLAGGTFFGALLGIPAGEFQIVLQKLSGVTSDEGRKQKQRELYEQKMRAWEKNLSTTKSILGETDDVSGGKTEERISGKMQ